MYKHMHVQIYRVIRKCLSQMVQSDWLLGGPFDLSDIQRSSMEVHYMFTTCI